ncbi:LysR family transcriptional regulator [Hydrogenophaga sp. BPS33]|uniref:LysR family transcriptional regulator n=1 Tax=Hydrogenophaga sp. BPS33 TaxID=2651974 RepID=UPI00135BCDF3|nr:LysR family transcriptional regulator [Hydrogenophaga sp. BPS33]
MREINITTVDMNLLRVFDVIYRERNLTRAGSFLCLTQSATSHALGRLRVLFDDELFVRAPHGLTPTPRAVQLSGLISPAVAAVQQALNAANGFDPETATMQLRISLTDYASSVLLPRLVHRLEREAPGIDIETSHAGPEEARDRLDTGQLDLAVVANGDHPTRFSLQHLFSEDYVCVAMHDHPLIEGGLTMPAFLQMRHVLVSAGTEQRSIVDRVLAAHGQRRRVAVKVPFLAGIANLLTGSEMLCTLPRTLADELCTRWPLRQFELPFDGVVAHYHALWSQRDDDSPAHKWLRALVAECCEGISCAHDGAV